jgi:putative transcriptional regulator
MTNRVGKLLIAHPNLPKSDWFHKTVIYIYIDNDKDGTIGVVTNVPTTLSVKKLCYNKGILFPDNRQLVYKGGPVADNTVMVFHTDEWSNQNTMSAGSRYSLTSDNTMFERLSMGDEPAYWKAIMGICGWRPGQLDLELSGQFPYTAENSWLTCDANDSILFKYDGEDQWVKAVELSSQQMINSYF